MRIMLRALLLLLVLSITLVPAAAQDEMLTFAAADCDYGGNLSSIEAVDALTVRVTLCNPDAIFHQEMASLGMAIHPSEYLNETGGTGDLLSRARLAPARSSSITGTRATKSFTAALMTTGARSRSRRLSSCAGAQSLPPERPSCAPALSTA